VRRLYEYRPIGKPGVVGAVVVGIVAAFGLFFEPAALNSSMKTHLVLAAAFGVAAFLFVLLVGQRSYWAIDDDGIAWRGRSLRNRRARWESLARVGLVWRGLGTLRGCVLELETTDGKRRLVGPSKRYDGRLEPEAVELLDTFSARYGFALGWAEPEPEAEEPAVPDAPAPLPGQTSMF
jgi:hypothetical protein